jgi:hypothetical protein
MKPTMGRIIQVAYGSAWRPAIVTESPDTWEEGSVLGMYALVFHTSPPYVNSIWLPLSGEGVAWRWPPRAD